MVDCYIWFVRDAFRPGGRVTLLMVDVGLSTLGDCGAQQANTVSSEVMLVSSSMTPHTLP